MQRAAPNNWKAVSNSFQKTNKFEFSILLLLYVCGCCCCCCSFPGAIQTGKPASKRRKNNVYTHYCTMCLGNAEFYLVSFSFYFCCVVPNMVHEKHSTFSIKQAFDMKANQIKEIISHPFWLSCFVSLYILVLDK